MRGVGFGDGGGARAVVQRPRSSKASKHCSSAAAAAAVRRSAMADAPARAQHVASAAAAASRARPTCVARSSSTRRPLTPSTRPPAYWERDAASDANAVSFSRLPLQAPRRRVLAGLARPRDAHRRVERRDTFIQGPARVAARVDEALIVAFRISGRQLLVGVGRRRARLVDAFCEFVDAQPIRIPLRGLEFRVRIR